MPYTPPDYSAPAAQRTSLEAARSRAIALLTDRYADDSLSEAEFEARLLWLSTADSESGIEQLVRELSEWRPAPVRPTTGYSLLPIAEDRLVAIMSATARAGDWALPGLLTVRAIMSEVVLDLRFATVPAGAEIDVHAIMANVRIILPPEMTVECRVSAFMGAVRNDAGYTTYPGYGAPRLLVTGSAVMSEVRIEVRPRMRD